MVKRMMLEWGLLLSFGATLAMLSMWVISRYYDPTPYHLRIATTGNVQHDLHILLAEGQLALCNQFERDSSGRVRPLVPGAGGISKRDRLRGDWRWQLTIPGFDFSLFWLARWRGLFWSLEQSLLIPAGLFLLLTTWFWFRLARLKSRTSTSGSITASSAVEVSSPAAG
jgi:hypothetical protein